jgi:alpha-beta hydrolase superfamily lysophospholipase
VRTVRAEGPAETGTSDGLAWARFEPSRGREPVGGVVILHGAGSRKESHFDFARACADGGMAALAFDARGHGESDGPLDGRVIDDVARMADVLRARGGAAKIALRGSSMGGYLALAAGVEARADAVVAICPASALGLATGIRAQAFDFAVDRNAAIATLKEHDEFDAIRALESTGTPVLLLHARGDEVVNVEHSEELHHAAPSSKLIVVPGGHHRSIQHDAELQGESIRWITRALR